MPSPTDDVPGGQAPGTPDATALISRRLAAVRLWLARALLALLIAWFSVGAYRVLGVAVHGRSVVRGASALWWSLRSPEGLDSAAVRGARERLGYLQRDLAGLRRWAAVPGRALASVGAGSAVGRYGVLLVDGLSLADALASTGWWALLEMESALEMPGTSGVDPLQTAVTRLGLDRAVLLEARESAGRVAQAVPGLAGLPAGGERLGALSPALVDGLLMAPGLFGADGRRVYLVVLQNPDELRPTGGFISSVAALVFEGYHLRSLDYRSAYDVETEGFEMPGAPAPLAEYMGAGGLTFRDANWSPDFETSARVLASLYQASREPVDGVVAIDTHLLRAILDAIGPVPVPAYGVTVTGDNLMEMSETFWENPLEGASLDERAYNLWDWLQHRKDFGGDFIEAGREHLAGAEPEALLSLGEALASGARERHLQAWAGTDAVLQEDLVRAGWSGALSQSTQGYALVVDANVGFNKVDRRIERSIRHDLALEGELPQLTVTLTYTNTAEARPDTCVHKPQVLESYEALTQQCYWNYVRLYVPRGAELLGTEGTVYAIDGGSESGHAFFGTLLVVPPGETLSAVFTLSLPATPACNDTLCRYTLLAEKQAGSVATPLTVAADVEPVTLALSDGVEPVAPRWPLVTTLRMSRTVVLTYKP